MTVDNLNNDLQDLENYLKNVKNKGCDENDLNIVLNVLQCPVFKNIVTVQNSLKELKKACLKHPSLGNANFNITSDGKLELINLPQDIGEQSRDELNDSGKSNLSEEDEKRFWHYVERAASGREMVKVNLFKSQNECLGFNVVGLRAEQVENLGIFVESIAKNGIADREGSLQVGDQILAIDREMLDGDICHKKAIEILQGADGHIELIVAKGKADRGTKLADNLVTSLPIEKSSNDLNLSSSGASAMGESKNERELNQFFQNEPHLEKFSQIELIELVNEGKGLGFGILGGKSTGVVVKTVIPGGVSDKDGRLKSGDHILQINNITLRGMSSEQVAQVLRTSGRNVKLLVARQKITLDQMPTDQAPTAFSSISTVEANIELTSKDDEPEREPAAEGEEEEEEKEEEEEEAVKPLEEEAYQEKNEVSIINQTNEEFDDQEVETIEVELVKDKKGLGITIAGYCMTDRRLNDVCDREDISGIYVKSIAPNSSADQSGKIQINDQIIEVDGVSLLEFTNHEAVEVLRNTGKVVHIKLARYLKGNKYDRLQLAISNVDFNVVKPLIPAKPNQTVLHVNSEQQSRQFGQDTIDNDSVFRSEKEMALLNLERAQEYWQGVLGDEYEIVVAQFSKFEACSGLGIALEGSFEQEPGQEPIPNHYIESILKQGPVGLNGVLRPGDQILQVNNTKIYHMEHNKVVKLLKELPIDVCMICARLKRIEKSVINLSGEPLADEQQPNFYEHDTLASSSGEPLTKERLVKAKSDGSLAIVNSSLEILKITRARSLEPLTGLAMWNSEPTEIELIKGERGLGFSILDYQSPLNPNQTVIVIRSLVSGGVAQQNGKLMPGDRLLEVNNCNLRNASLDLAVQALKGAPKGPVKLLVAKPLPIAEQSSGQLANINYANFSTPLSNRNLDIPLLVQEELAEIEQQSESDTRQDSDWKSVDIDDFEKADFELKTALEKSYFNRDDSILINRSRSYSPLSMQYEPNYMDGIDDLGYTEIPIPTELERLIVLHKKNQSLGVTLELTTEGINGLIVRALSKKGLLYKDGRIHTGDNLLGINNESLRNATTSKARAIFKRVNLVEGDVPLKYVPESEAICYRRNSSIEKSKSQRSLPCFKQYCRTPSPTQSNPSLNPPF